ncbi:Protein of unknown function [Gryllus bimaculatus]|nr:Protein of unknown function [Gryllus bimaculatus]
MEAWRRRVGAGAVGASALDPMKACSARAAAAGGWSGRGAGAGAAGAVAGVGAAAGKARGSDESMIRAGGGGGNGGGGGRHSPPRMDRTGPRKRVQDKKKKRLCPDCHRSVSSRLYLQCEDPHRSTFSLASLSLRASDLTLSSRQATSSV